MTEMTLPAGICPVVAARAADGSLHPIADTRVELCVDENLRLGCFETDADGRPRLPAATSWLGDLLRSWWRESSIADLFADEHEETVEEVEETAGAPVWIATGQPLLVGFPPDGQDAAPKRLESRLEQQDGDWFLIVDQPTRFALSIGLAGKVKDATAVEVQATQSGRALAVEEQAFRAGALRSYRVVLGGLVPGLLQVTATATLADGRSRCLGDVFHGPLSAHQLYSA